MHCWVRLLSLGSWYPTHDKKYKSFITLVSLVQAVFVPFSVIVCSLTYIVLLHGDVSNSFMAG